jgi:DNA-binding transcriptional ArsR family regulator
VAALPMLPPAHEGSVKAGGKASHEHSGGPIRARRLTPDQLHLVADRFKALAEPSRLAVLQALRGDERSVSQLVADTGLGQANLSKHLQLLHGAGFLDRRREGVSVMYRLADADVLALCELMCRRLEHEATSRLHAVRRGGARE